MKFLVKTLISAMALSAISFQASADPVTVNSCDRQVTFKNPPQRAISNDVNLTEMMLVLGLRDRMVGYTGISGWKTLDTEIRKDIHELPELSPKYPTKEVIIGADADFYFAGWNYGMKVGGEVTPISLAKFDINVYELSESCIHVMKMQKPSMDIMYNDILNLGKIFQVEDRAKELVDGYKMELSEFKEGLKLQSDPTRVFVYDSGEDQPFTSGRFGMPNAMIEAAGGQNIMDDVEKSWTKVGWEPVIDRDPEVIVIVNYGDVTAAQKRDFMMSNPAFSEIDAVKNDRFVVLDYVEATPGPRNILAVKKLASAFYPTN